MDFVIEMVLVFELGFDSIDMIKLFVRFKRKYGLLFGISDFMKV